MDRIFLTIFFLSTSSIVYSTDSIENQPPKLLLISLDGLRYDFITPERTPNLYLLSRQGVFFERGIKAQVHTVTASNHYTISTGLYQDSHGIIDNVFWDPVLNETYDIWNFRDNQTQYERSKLAFWYEGTTPIWQTNEDSQYSNGYTQKNRRRSGSLYWPMGDCYINNKTILKNTTWTEFGNISMWMKEIDKLVSWFADDKDPINFVLYYNAQPDHVEHHTGVYSTATGNEIDQIDATMRYLFDKLQEALLWDKINIILTADHGHANIPDLDHILPLDDYLDFNKTILNARSFFPKPGSGVTADEIYENLTRAQREEKYPIRIWRKENFPTHYHYTNNRRIGPVIAYEEIGYELIWNDTPANFIHKTNRSLPYSTHGYLNDYSEMRPFFIAYGPAFKARLFVSDREDIENVDLYPLMCKILGIDPLPNNGSLDRIKFILRGESDSQSTYKFGVLPIKFWKTEKYVAMVLTMISLIGFAVPCLIWMICVCRKRKLFPCIKASTESGFEYRRLRNASPEAYVELNRRPTRSKRDTASGAANSKPQNFKVNGNSRASTRQIRSKSPIEDGPHQLVPLSDLGASSDENEL